MFCLYTAHEETREVAQPAGGLILVPCNYLFLFYVKSSYSFFEFHNYAVCFHILNLELLIN